MKKSFCFSNEESNIKISFFSVESEEIAWKNLEQSIKQREEEYGVEMPNFRDFQVKEIG